MLTEEEMSQDGQRKQINERKKINKIDSRYWKEGRDVRVMLWSKQSSEKKGVVCIPQNHKDEEDVNTLVKHIR